MKRRLMILVSALMLFVASSEPLCAQWSMLDGDPVWVYRQEVEWNVKNAPENTLIWNEPMYFIHTYTIKGDTTIQGKVYKKLYHEFQNEKHQYLFGTNGGELVTPLREEGNKILAPRSFYQQRWGDAEWYYEMEGSNNDEIVVYDFDALKKGKVSIEQKGQIFSHFIVTTVEKRLADKTLHQVYDFGSDKDETSQQKTLLQITDGIGCNKDNVLLFAPFADDSFILPDEIEAEMTIETHTMTGISMYPTEDEDSYPSRTYRSLECTWDWGTFSYTIYEDINELTIDDTWVRTTEDGKMMVTLEKFSYRPSSILCYYVQNGKIVYQNTGWNIGYHFIEKYLDYHINEEAEMVDLGLSVKWSTHNVGAASAADFGQYFFWGDTIGTERPSDDLQSVAYTGHYSEYENRLQNHIAKTKFDAAYRLQGKNWRMPTDAEYKELIDSCTCVEVYMNHADGYLLTGPNGNTLFLPKTDGMSLKQNGMSLSSEYNNEAVYWTETLIENNNGNKVNVKVYHNNQLKATTRYDSHYSTHPPKALPIRAVYDESGDKWLSVNEYLYYNRYDLIKWGWNENDVVIPSIEACNDFFARHQDVFGVSDGMDNQMVHQVFCENFRRYVADRFETYKSRAVDTYEGSDGKTLYFVDQIDDDLLDVFDARLGQIDLMAAINLEEDDRGNPLFTKNCTYKMEDVDPKFGVPGNQYLYAIPTSQSAQPYIGFNLPSLLANTNYTIRITMAPEAIDSIAPQPNKFRVNMFFKGIEGDWPKTRNFVFRNPLDPTGKEQDFTSSADTLTVYDIPLTLSYSTDVMVQLQAYVSSAETKTYTRHLRIANIEIIKQDTQNNENVQNDSIAQYLPFVEEGKVWRTFASHLSSKGNKVKGYFSGEEIKGGKTYSVMYSQKENDTPLKVGLYREENKKVYEYNEESGTEYVIYDFSLKVGDEFTSTIPFVRRFRVESEGEMVVNGYHLRTLSLLSEDPDYNHGLYWIEGLGGKDGPFGGLYSERPGSQRADIAYVQYGKQSNFAYLPFIFNDINHEWQGAPAFLSEEKYDTHEDAGLKYEVVGCRLHVYGYLWASPGSSNYLFFKEEETGTPMSHVFRVEREFTDIFEGAEVGLYYVDLYTRDCGVYYNYKVVDEFGEHDAVNRNLEYHLFIEENKVWKVGYADAGNPVQFVEYYYFDGDTIIDGKTSKKMMCLQVANDGPWCYDGRYSASEPLKYCGAFYEQDRKVYYAANDSSKYKVIYDFSITGDEYYDDVNVGINGHSFHVGPRRTEGMNTFKGIYMNLSNQNVWMEGVGSDIAPIYPVHYGDENRIMFLMSCTVGDEVIYLNDEYEDGTIPEGEEAKKRRFDFNHTVKTQPKTPLRRGEETALYGEYNNQLLDINLKMLNTAYMVRITNQNTGEVVYEKAVNAGSIVALDIDISEYPKGQYAITIENSKEVFTGQFDTDTTGISPLPASPKGEEMIYNLQGQRMNSLQKGFNIIEGKKIFVK